jgi:proline iminopeptidase
LGRYDARAYIDATDVFYANYLMRTDIQHIPIPSECKEVPGFNLAIYEYMWGPTEFTATGTLRDFDRINGLKELKVPVLFVAGEYDEVLAETLYMYQSMVPGSEAAIIPEAGHAKTIDNPEDYINTIKNFLRKVEKRQQNN